MQSLRLWLAFALAISTLFLACWIFINAPTRALLPLSVGAPEISAWLSLASLIAIALAILSIRTRLLARVTLVCAALAFGLAVTPLVRFPFSARRFDSAMQQALGAGTGRRIAADSLASQLFSRTSTLSVAELFRGVPPGRARVVRGVRVGVIDGVTLTVDIYRPNGAGIFPTVVQIYGGAWQRGNPGDNAAFAAWSRRGGTSSLRLIIGTRRRLDGRRSSTTCAQTSRGFGIMLRNTVPTRHAWRFSAARPARSSP